MMRSDAIDTRRFEDLALVLGFGILLIMGVRLLGGRSVGGGGERILSALTPLSSTGVRGLQTGSTCRWGIPLQVRLTQREPAVIGSLVSFAIEVANPMGEGEYTWWFQYPPSSLDTGSAKESWTETLRQGETRIVRIVARVTSTDPLLIAARMAPADWLDRRIQPVQDALMVYPYEVRGDRVVSTWDPDSRWAAHRRPTFIRPSGGGERGIVAKFVAARAEAHRR